MAGVKLDGAGQVRIQTLHEAMVLLQRCHGVVEGMAMDVKNSRPTSGAVMQFKRVATPLASKLKGQYGMISDVLISMILASSRGGGDQVKVRVLREGIASVRQQLEIAEVQVMEKHAVGDDKHSADEGTVAHD
jgi:hypothetical protein